MIRKKILLKNVQKDLFENLQRDFELIIYDGCEECPLESFYYIFSSTPLDTDYKMISYITSETDIEELLKWFNSWSRLRCHLVGIAKNEERYIEDWCLWYFLMGIDKIAIYDNNDDSKKGVLENLLRNSSKLKSFKNRIEVIPWKGKQDEAYEDYWKTHDFDWLTINDIDEFIQLNSSETNIKALLSRYHSKQMLSLKCLEYGDNGLIKRSQEDKLKPVWEVFTRLSERIYSRFYKSSFNKNLIKRFRTLSGHCLRYGERVTKISDYLGNEHRKYYSQNGFEIAPREPYIKHFRTYSLKEYCQQKLNIRHQFNGGDIRRSLLSQYYYKINSRTTDKDEFARNWRKEHSQNYLFMCSEETFAKNHWLKECFCYVFGNPFGTIEGLKSNTRFQGIRSLNEIIDDMDYVVFIL